MIDHNTEHEIQRIAFERHNAEDMIARLSRTIPEALGAAQRAAAHLDAGDVVCQRPHIDAADGQPEQHDRWTVDGHVCSHTDKGACTCSEAAHIDPKFGRLCSHRLAVMLYKRQMQINADALIKLIDLLRNAEPEKPRIVIEIDRYYRDNEDRKLIRSIGYGRQTGSRLDYTAQFEIDNAGLERAAAAAGLTFKAPSKGSSFRYYYTLEQQEAPAANGLTLRQHDAAPFVARDARRAQLAAETAAVRRLVSAAA
jgi:hypothetical protein